MARDLNAAIREKQLREGLTANHDALVDMPKEQLVRMVMAGQMAVGELSLLLAKRQLPDGTPEAQEVKATESGLSAVERAKTTIETYLPTTGLREAQDAPDGA